MSLDLVFCSVDIVLGRFLCQQLFLSAAAFARSSLALCSTASRIPSLVVPTWESSRIMCRISVLTVFFHQHKGVHFRIVRIPPFRHNL